jgi:tight adherence protein B
MFLNGFVMIVLAGLMGAYFLVVFKRKRKVEKKQSSQKTPHLMHTSENPIHNPGKGAGNRTLIDYSCYQLNKFEYCKYAVTAGLFLFIIGYLFYGHFIAALLIAILGLVYPRIQKKTLIEKRKSELKMQFKEAIASLSSSLAAGRSIENGFREVANDLKLLYPDPNTYILQEFEVINRRVENGETIEKTIEEFAKRSHVEEILNFSDVFITCKRTGGDLVDVIRRTSDIISEKLDVQQEISVMIAQKRFESRVLSLIPLGMIVMLKYSAGDYMKPLYDWHGMGPFVMTGCLAILCFSYWLSQKIMKIKV